MNLRGVREYGSYYYIVLSYISHRQHPSRNSSDLPQPRESPEALNTDEQAGKQGSTHRIDDEAFDPARFRVDLIDPAIEAIPARKIDLGITNRVAGWFGAIPLAAASFYPPPARVLILLSALCRLQKPDVEGGWYKLSTSRYSAVGLDDKDVRARAVAACEKVGAIEVLRSRGKAVHVRFTEMARLTHRVKG